MAVKKLTPLTLEEQASTGFTHMLVLNVDDLTETATNTTQTITSSTVPANWIINKVMAKLITAFKDASDAAYNTTTLIVGDAGSANRYITSAQLNENGTEITAPQYNNTAYEVLVATPLLIVFGAQSGKAISDLDVGEVHLFFQIIDTTVLSALKGTTSLVGT